MRWSLQAHEVKKEKPRKFGTKFQKKKKKKKKRKKKAYSKGEQRKF